MSATHHVLREACVSCVCEKKRKCSSVMLGDGFQFHYRLYARLISSHPSSHSVFFGSGRWRLGVLGDRNHALSGTDGSGKWVG